MGCGASAPQTLPPAPAKATKTGIASSSGSPAGIELVLVLGTEVAGGTALCESLAKVAGRQWHHVDFQALVSAEIATGSALGGELAALHGKLPERSVCGQLIKKKLAGVTAGVCLLQGYPASLPSLSSMAEEVGHTPTLALLLELDESAAAAKLTAAGKDGASAAEALRSFEEATQEMLGELEKRAILHRLDASAAPETLLAAARSLVDSTTRSAANRGLAALGSAAAASSAKRVLVFGAPGAGVSEQCARLSAAFECVHISIEALMRTEVRDETETGRAISELVKGGKIVPAHLYIALLKSAVERQKAPDAPCLVDGFPRSLDNLSLLEAQMGGCQHALLLDANESILEERLMQPAANGGKPAEATAEGAQRRIRTFKNQTLPAILALEGRGKLTRVDASGSPDATFAAVSAAYQSMGLQ